MNYTVEEFALCLLHAVTNSHILHLRTRSFAEHKALEIFYTEIGDIADTYIETYQGKYGIIEQYGPSYQEPPGSPLEYLISLSDYVFEARQHLKQDTELQNITDEIAQLINQTIYRLRFLK